MNPLHLYLKESEFKDIGVYSKKVIREGEYICDYTGKVYERSSYLQENAENSTPYAAEIEVGPDMYVVCDA